MSRLSFLLFSQAPVLQDAKYQWQQGHRPGLAEGRQVEAGPLRPHVARIPGLRGASGAGACKVADNRRPRQPKQMAVSMLFAYHNRGL